VHFLHGGRHLVRYPLFGKIPSDTFSDYEISHRNWTSAVVLPPMTLELFSSLVLPMLVHNGIERLLLLCGAGLTLIIWSSTIFLQMPIHLKLSDGKNGNLIARLVLTNWIRTVGWTIRSGIVVLLMMSFY
jgi:hypothetical protein